MHIDKSACTCTQTHANREINISFLFKQMNEAFESISSNEPLSQENDIERER